MTVDELRRAARLGGLGILTSKDLEELSAGCKRVLGFMADGRWHSASSIRLIAGKNGTPASEGLRRMRELRSTGLVVDRRRSSTESRLFEYRLVASDIRDDWMKEEW